MKALEHVMELEMRGDLKGWMKARVSRLWQRRGRPAMLFEYLTKTKRPMLAFDADGVREPVRGYSPVRRKQRWETRDHVTLRITADGVDCDDSPAHLSGFGSAPGRSTLRGVSGPRHEVPDVPPQLNRQFDFKGGST